MTTLTKEQAYKILDLDITKNYTKQEVQNRYSYFNQILEDEIRKANDYGELEHKWQMIEQERLLTAAKIVVFDDIEEREKNQVPANGIEPYRGIEKYEALKPYEELACLDKEGSKKNKKVIKGNLIKIIASGLALALVGTGIGYLIGSNNKKNKNKPTETMEPITITATPKLTPTPTMTPEVTPNLESPVKQKKQEIFTLLEEIKQIEATGNKNDKTVLEKEQQMLSLVKEIESELTDFEKADILLVLDDNYARGMNQVEGMELTEEEGLISLSYLNGIAPEVSGAKTDDITLDFILDFETYWNKLNYDAKKYLGANIECKHDDYSQYGDLVSNYILNEKESLVIGHMIKERLTINKEAHAGNYDKAHNLAVKLIEQDVKMYTSFEDLKINGTKINIGTLSPWAQYLISFIAYADTGYVKDDTVITTINDCIITNGNADDTAYHYDADKSFIMQSTARNNINWHLEANSINAYNAFVKQSIKTLCK